VEGYDGAKEEDGQPFLSPAYPFGGNINVTRVENDIMIEQYDGTQQANPGQWFSRVDNEKKQRILYNPNRLGRLEAPLKEIRYPAAFWNEVMKIAPPKQWMDQNKIIGYLTRC
jgi:hypothetical protein